MNEEAVYNIGVVARMTGIPENTLRVWERRYHFPESSRTDGGHRLYSPREVARIQWVKQRINEGMQTRNAIRALEQIEEEGRFPDTLTQGRAHYALASDASTEVIRERLYEALTAHDANWARQVLGEALASHTIEGMILNVISPTFTAIGTAWAEGRLNIATEHFATNHLRHQLLMWMQTAPPAYHVRPVILACAPGDLHEGGLIMLGVLLRRLRWPVVYLGQSIDLSDFASFVDDLNPSVTVFAAMTPESAEALSHWPDYLSNGQVLVTFAGYIFAEHPEWIERVPGSYLGNTLSEGLQNLDNLLREMNPLAR